VGGVVIDFDVIYELAIRPAISEAGLEPIRGDKERTGGIIHVPMFARILLAEFMVADLTLANPNVFYELGIRHAMKPFTTVPIFATTGSLPFDVGMVRSIGYELKDGQLSAAAAEKLRTAIKERLDEAVHGSTQADSPVYQLIPDLCSPDLPPSVEQVLKDRLSEQFRFDFSTIDPWLQFKKFELFETQTLAARSVLLDQIQAAKVSQDPVLFLEP
jgi:hypothetical protein